MWCLNLTTTLLSSSCTAIQSPPNGHLKQEVDDDDNHVEDINNDHGLYSNDENLDLRNNWQNSWLFVFVSQCTIDDDDSDTGDDNGSDGDDDDDDDAAMMKFL